MPTHNRAKWIPLARLKDELENYQRGIEADKLKVATNGSVTKISAT
jgi:hypothetical protein